jgi:protein tyrosine phosphatase (PTP) superfamily phosphohydrolase (DUF442 family)
MPRNVPALALFTLVGSLIAMDRNAQVVKQEVEGIRNFAKVESTVACAGAISPAAIAEIKKMGYQAIINLRLPTEQGADIEKHAAVAKSVGLPYYSIPFSATEPDPAAVEQLLKVIQTPGVQPAFIH